MFIIYDLAYFLAALISSPIWIFKLLKTGKWKTDWGGKLGKVKGEVTPSADSKTILFHAVSVGEVAALRSLISFLENNHPKFNLVIATTTNTGYDRAVKLYGHNHKIVRYPLDFSFAVKKFLRALKPDALVLVELELWPNMLSLCKKRKIPVCVVNGRLSARSFKRYKALPPPFSKVVKNMFASLTAGGVQSEEYAQRFIALGSAPERVQILDTMKWDNAKITDDVNGASQLAQEMGIDRNKPVIVAGSTGPGEEQMLIENCPKEAQLVLVPRKPERFEEVAKLDNTIIRRTKRAVHVAAQQRSKRTGGDFQQDAPLQTGFGAIPPEIGNLKLFLIDTMGELSKAYGLADIAIVGRSFNGQGGSDPIEPIALGKPTIIGPDYDNFQSVVQAFAKGNGIVITKDVKKDLRQLLKNKEKAAQIAQNGRDVIKSRQGSSKRHADMIMDILKI